MKKIIILIAAIVMAAVSCTKETAPEFVNDEPAKGKLTATFVQTKVSYTVTSGNNLQPAWEVGDEIIGFDDAGNTYTLSVASVSAETATLSGTVPDGVLHLIYKSGASASDIKSKTLTVSYDMQNGDKTMPAVMLADGIVKNGGCEFTFTNAGAIIGINAVNGIPSGTAINKITVQGLNLPTATVSLNGSSLTLATSTKIGNISTAALSGITVTDAYGTLSSPVFVAVPAGAEISSIVVNEGFIYNLASPKTVEAGQYLYVRNQTFLPSVRYVVHYALWDGKEIITPERVPLSADKYGYCILGAEVTEYAKPIEELNRPYNSKKNGEYQYNIITPSKTKTITRDLEEIIILYMKKEF